MKYLRLEYEWKKNGFSRVTFAKAMGMSASQLNDRLNQKTEWRLGEAIRASSLLDVDVKELFAQ